MGGRIFQGINLYAWRDNQEQWREMKNLEVFLADISRQFNTTEPSTPTSVTGAPNDLTYITVSSESALSKERRLNVSNPLTLTDNGANSTIVVNAPLSGSPVDLGPAASDGSTGLLIDAGHIHGIASPPGPEFDDFLIKAPQTLTRNQVTAGGTSLGVGIDIGEWLTFEGTVPTNWDSADFISGLLFGGNERSGFISASSGSTFMTLGANALVKTSGLGATSLEWDNLVDTTRGAGFISLIGPLTAAGSVIASANDRDVPFVRMSHRIRDGGGTGDGRVWAPFEMRAGADERGKFVFGGDLIGTQGSQRTSGGTSEFSTDSFRVVIASTDGGVLTSATAIGGLFIDSIGAYNNSHVGIPLSLLVNGQSTIPTASTAGEMHLINCRNGATVRDAGLTPAGGADNQNQTSRLMSQFAPWYDQSSTWGGSPGIKGRWLTTLQGISQTVSGGSEFTDTIRMRCRHYLWIDTEGTLAGVVPATDPTCIGGIRMGDKYILGVDSTDSDLLKLWTIGDTTDIADASLPSTESASISVTSIEGAGGTGGFLGTDNTTTNSGLAYTFTNAIPFDFAATATGIQWGVGPSGLEGFVFTGRTSSTGNYTFKADSGGAGVIIAAAGSGGGSSGITISGTNSFLQSSGGLLLSSLSGDFDMVAQSGTITFDGTDIQFLSASSTVIRTTAAAADITIQSDLGDITIESVVGDVFIKADVLDTAGGRIIMSDSDPATQNATAIETVATTGNVVINRDLVITESAITLSGADPTFTFGDAGATEILSFVGTGTNTQVLSLETDATNYVRALITSGVSSGLLLASSAGATSLTGGGTVFTINTIIGAIPINITSGADITIDAGAGSQIKLLDDTKLNDNRKLIIGSGSDAEIYYDATDLVINPSAVGTGFVKIPSAVPLRLPGLQTGTIDMATITVGDMTAGSFSSELRIINTVGGTMFATALSVEFSGAIFKLSQAAAASNFVSTTLMSFQSAAATSIKFIPGAGSLIHLNSSLTDSDTQISGDTVTALLYVNAGADTVCVGTTGGTSLLNINGGIALKLKTITSADSPYTLVPLTDYTLLCDCSSGAITVITSAVTNIGSVFNIKKIDSSANAVTVDPPGGITIDGSLTAVISLQYDSITIHNDGSDWWIT